MSLARFGKVENAVLMSHPFESTIWRPLSIMSWLYIWGVFAGILYRSSQGNYLVSTNTADLLFFLLILTLGGAVFVMLLRHRVKHAPQLILYSSWVAWFILGLALSSQLVIALTLPLAIQFGIATLGLRQRWKNLNQSGKTLQIVFEWLTACAVPVAIFTFSTYLNGYHGQPLYLFLVTFMVLSFFWSSRDAWNLSRVLAAKAGNDPHEQEFAQAALLTAAWFWPFWMLDMKGDLITGRDLKAGVRLDEDA